MPGNSKYDGRGQRKFIRNMAAGGATGAVAGNVGAKVLTRGRSRLMPVRSAAIGGTAAGGVGVGMVSHLRRSKKKVHKSMGISAFGVDHGEVSKSIPTAMRAIESNAGKLKAVPGRGLAGKHAMPMQPVKSGSSVGRRRAGGGVHSQGLFAR